jgi:hypothetical protein
MSASAADTITGCRTDSEAFVGNDRPALFASAVGARLESLERVVNLGETVACLLAQRGDLRPLERDRRTFGIVLIVEVAAVRGSDDVADLLGRCSELGQGCVAISVQCPCGVLRIHSSIVVLNTRRRLTGHSTPLRGSP